MNNCVGFSTRSRAPWRIRADVRVRLRMRGVAIAATAALAACASTPKVAVSYYFPKAQTHLTITQTFVCPISVSPGDQPSVVAAVTQNTAYVADPDQQPWQIDFSAISGVFSDADTAFNLTDDGRLSGVNASSTGEGDKIAQDVISLTSVVAGGAVAVGAEGTPQGPQAQATGACAVVRKHFAGDATKTPPSASMTYTINLLYSAQPSPTATPASGIQATSPDNGATKILIGADLETNTSIPKDEIGWHEKLTVLPDQGSEAFKSELKPTLPVDRSDQFTFLVKIVKVRFGKDGTKWTDESTADSGAPVVRLNRSAIVDLAVLGPSLNNGKSLGPIWKAEVSVPIASYYDVPIPKGAVFGKTQFALSLTNSGGISKLEYGTTTGAADEGDLAVALGKAIKGPSAEQQASVSQGKADKIYEDHRLAICTASAANCPSK